MFLISLGSSDERFKTIRFREGLNLVVADRTEASDQGDSRNGTGKSSLLRILRYILGGSAPSEFKAAVLEDHDFHARFNLPAREQGVADDVTVTRAVKPMTRLDIKGWSRHSGGELHIDEWRELMGQHIWHLPEDTSSPTVGQLWSQIIRTYFGAPTKIHNAEAGWETGVRLGYFLGLDPTVLSRSGALKVLTNQRDAIKKAVKDGVLDHLTLDEAGLRSRLATLRRNRDRVEGGLRLFKVDEQYGEHQRRADELSMQIRALNDEALIVERRLGEIVRSADQVIDSSTEELQARLARVYGEVRIVLPGLVARRFEEVALFHESVIRNRQEFLREEGDGLRRRMEQIVAERGDLDGGRSAVMQLLQDTVALDTFLDAHRSLSGLDAEVADIERRLASAVSVNQIDDTLKLQTAETVGAVRAEIAERSNSLDRPISLFNELGTEIYLDREANLLISPSPKGILDVTPSVSGDASDGIRCVETYLLDMVCLISGIENGRAPGILVHDSHIFDSIDHRQVASCLNIGARLADQYNFQYIVTMNSDFLQSVVLQSEGAFDPTPYQLDVRLTDESEDGGLFGFAFR
jgi:uncharacterized protein YydD (DUF2326 family)